MNKIDQMGWKLGGLKILNIAFIMALIRPVLKEKCLEKIIIFPYSNCQQIKIKMR